jgi:hypothetical protein
MTHQSTQQQAKWATPIYQQTSYDTESQLSRRQSHQQSICTCIVLDSRQHRLLTADMTPTRCDCAIQRLQQLLMLLLINAGPAAAAHAAALKPTLHLPT